MSPKEPGKPFALTLQVDTSPDHIRMARKAVASTVASSGASRAVTADIELALGEALANAYRHAYGGATGPIQVDLEWRWVSESEILWMISVHDHGTAVTPPVVPSEIAVDAEGRGLYLIAKLMDRITIVVNPSTRKGVSITMEKTAPAAWRPLPTVSTSKE